MSDGKSAPTVVERKSTSVSFLPLVRSPLSPSSSSVLFSATSEFLTLLFPSGGVSIYQLSINERKDTNVALFSSSDIFYTCRGPQGSPPFPTSICLNRGYTGVHCLHSFLGQIKNAVFLIVFCTLNSLSQMFINFLPRHSYALMLCGLGGCQNALLSFAYSLRKLPPALSLFLSYRFPVPPHIFLIFLSVISA